MKKFKDIREQAGFVSPKDGYPQYKVDKTDQATIGAIGQAISYELLDKSYMDPKAAFNNLKIKLNTINLDFDIPDESKLYNTGSFSIPLTKATADFGKTVDTPYDEWHKDTGLSGITLNIKITQDENNLYKLSAKVTG